MNLSDLITPYEPDPVFLASIITSMYAPADHAADADELVSQLDLLESLRATEPELTSKHVYDAMLELQFTPKTIEGAIYWPAMNA